MASWGQLWAVGSISHLVHDLFAEKPFIIESQTMTGSSWTPAVPWWEDALASNTAGYSRAAWGTADCLVFLISTSPCTHNVLPPTEPWKSSRALITLLCPLFGTSPSLGNLSLPQYLKSVRQLRDGKFTQSCPQLGFLWPMTTTSKLLSLSVCVVGITTLWPGLCWPGLFLLLKSQEIIP